MIRRNRSDTAPARIAAAIIALIAWGALALRTQITIVEFTAAGDTIVQGLWHLAGYFTIWTTLLVALAMTAIAFGRWPGGRSPSDATLAALALYVVVVGVVNHVLLRGLIDYTPIEQVADTLLHYVTPTLVVLWWLTFAPKERLRFRHAFLWLAYPLLYCAAALVRGAATGWYPYPFLDVRSLGYSGVLASAAGLGAVIAVSGVIVILIARAIGAGKN